jgi:hypothetical protein
MKNAALLALVGMFLLTVLMLADLIRDTSGVIRDLIPVMTLFRSLIYTFAGLTVSVFFYVFYKRQA